MQLAQDTGAFTPPEPFVASRAFTLAGADGKKTVNVRYIDGAGNISKSFADTITLDTTAPVVTAVSATPSPFVLGATTTIRFRAADALSGTCHAGHRHPQRRRWDRAELQPERGVRRRRHRDVDDLGRPQRRARAGAAGHLHNRSRRHRCRRQRVSRRPWTWWRSERRDSAPGLEGQDARDRPGKLLLVPRDDRGVGSDGDFRGQ